MSIAITVVVLNKGFPFDSDRFRRGHQENLVIVRQLLAFRRPACALPRAGARAAERNKRQDEKKKV